MASDLRKAAIERIFGFEILPAPFVVAHLQLGLLLQQLGAPLPDNPDARVGVFLTNALTGWDPDAKHPDLPFRELAEERDRAGAVKQAKPILVILGNPPYNGYAGVTASAEERALSNEYRKTKRAPAPQGQGLNDLYVRFFRMAERKIVEQTGRGIVCFISNYSWLDGLSFTGMRERYLEVYDRIWIDCLNGDKYRTGKLTPEGEPDASIFSTPSNREGIQVGTAIALLARTPAYQGTELLRHRELWGASKLKQLGSESLSGPGPYSQIPPQLHLGLPFRQLESDAGYASWPPLHSLFRSSFAGIKTSRDAFLIDVDRTALGERLAGYLDPALSDQEARLKFPEAMNATSRYDPSAVRSALAETGYSPDKIVRYAFRPFDHRWIYWEGRTKLLDEKRPEFIPQVARNNPMIEARQRQPKEAFDRGYVTTVLADNFGNGLSSYFPLRVRAALTAEGLFANDAWKYNLGPAGTAFLESASLSPELLFDHCVGILHCPQFRAENQGALRQDWPRIPLPASKEALERSAGLGAELRQLLDPEVPVIDAPASGYPDRFRGVGDLTSADGASLDPEAGDLAVTAGWGIRGKGGITMPARGRLTDNGESVDVWLNDRAYWANVPKTVWEYTLDGYQVIKKWLSYREKALLGRDLTEEEARYVTEMVRRIAAIISLGPALDDSYEAVKAEVWEWGEG